MASVVMANSFFWPLYTFKSTFPRLRFSHILRHCVRYKSTYDLQSS